MQRIVHIPADYSVRIAPPNTGYRQATLFPGPGMAFLNFVEVGEENEIWIRSKREPEENGEFDDRAGSGMR